MDSHSIADKHGEDAPAELQPGGNSNAELPGRSWPGTASELPQPAMRFPAEDGGRSLAEMAQRDLTATLQLLAERAQYITGATGAAIALKDHEEMVCRASVGSSAPEVGAQLQVNSGLSGESVRTRQTLRCDDATTDGRVNRESCEALGIRSVVVMPLLRGDDVIGVFELFSDKANVFEARDITALERMAGMVHTALEHSAAAFGIAAETRAENRPVPSRPEARFEEEEDEPGFALDAGLARPSAVEMSGAPVEAIQIPDLGSGKPAAPMGRFEALAAAQASSRIAFHKKASPAASAAPETTPVTTPELVQGELPPVPPPKAAPEKASSVEQKEVSPVESLSAASDGVREEPPKIEAAGNPADQALTDEMVAVEDDAVLKATVPSPTPVAVSMEREVSAQVAMPEAAPPVAVARGAIANLRKCAACGFPVSEGRQLCLDCEKKKVQLPTAAANAAPLDVGPISQAKQVTSEVTSNNPTTEMPRFLSGEEEEASWLATHKLMVVAMVLALAVIVVLMVLR